LVAAAVKYTAVQSNTLTVGNELVRADRHATIAGIDKDWTTTSFVVASIVLARPASEVSGR
jgi:hypothetical protein